MTTAATIRSPDDWNRMAIDPSQLLRRLEPAVRPGSVSSSTRRPHQPLDQCGFDALMTMVARGDVQSGRSVQCDPSLDPPFDDEQRQRLAAAADEAEAEGAQCAVMIIDGRAVVMDVAERVIDTEISARGGAKVFTRVDAAVYVPGGDDDTDRRLPPFPGSGLVPGVVARQLERALLLGDAATADQPLGRSDRQTEHNR